MHTSLGVRTGQKLCLITTQLIPQQFFIYSNQSQDCAGLGAYKCTAQNTSRMVYFYWFTQALYVDLEEVFLPSISNAQVAREAPNHPPNRASLKLAIGSSDCGADGSTILEPSESWSNARASFRASSDSGTTLDSVIVDESL